MRFSDATRHFKALAAVGCIVMLGGCSEAPDTAKPSGITPQAFADGVHAVMMADRTVYAKHVVTRLKQQKAPVGPSEYWEDEDSTIPLPAQMFRMGSELVADNGEAGFTYALKSKWPLNAQNKAKTELEISGIDYLAEHPGENYYETEVIAGTKYFTAFYPDEAVAQACWTCHNEHPNREDSYPEFAEGDVMGAVIVRIPLSE